MAPFEAKFEVWLPPGSYRLEAYSQFADREEFEGELRPSKAIVLGTETTDVELGRLSLAPIDLTGRPWKRRQRLRALGTTTLNTTASRRLAGTPPTPAA